MYSSLPFRRTALASLKIHARAQDTQPPQAADLHALLPVPEILTGRIPEILSGLRKETGDESREGGGV